MGKTRDLFKKIRDTKGTFHAKMGSIKDRNGMDLTEAEDIKKRWQEYTEASIQCCSVFFMIQLSHPDMTIGKTIALTRRTFVGKVMSLLFNILFQLVIAFLPRSKCLLISWLQSPSAVILESKKIQSVTVFYCFPIYLP